MDMFNSSSPSILSWWYSASLAACSALRLGVGGKLGIRNRETNMHVTF